MLDEKNPRLEKLHKSQFCISYELFQTLVIDSFSFFFFFFQMVHLLSLSCQVRTPVRINIRAEIIL